MENGPADRHRGLSPQDLAGVSHFVDFPTWRKGRRYAADGAVLEQSWDDEGTTGMGLVDGTAAEPYEVSVRLGRSPTGRITDLVSSCTCPVGGLCKHAVALLVAAGSDPGAAGQARHIGTIGRAGPVSLALVGATPFEAEWERRLRGVLADARQPEPTGPGGLAGGSPAIGAGQTLGLQFELAQRPSAGHLRAPTTPGIRLRPVTPSRAGNWVRSGVGWSQLETLAHGRGMAPRTAEQVALLRELRALGHLGPAGRWQGWGDDAVWFEAIQSRRVWDVLSHAGELGIPLLRPGREGAPIDLHDGTLEVVADLTRTDHGLRLRPHLVLDDIALSPAGWLPVGSPAHGLAWWDQPSLPDRTPHLHLAPFNRPLDAATAGLLAAEPIEVPADDAGRFEATVVPVLRRRVTVRSSDDSVPLPDVAAAPVRLTLRHREGPALDLTWVLPTVGAGGGGAVPAAIELAARVPGLVAQTPWGPRLVPSAQLEGIDALHFLTSVLPAIAELDGVAVAHHGDAPDLREETGPPVIRLEGDPDAGGDWLDLGVEVLVGNEVVPFADLFTALAEGRTHLVLPSGTWFSLDHEPLRRLAALIAEARSLHDAPPGRARLSRYQASLWGDLEDLGGADLGAGAWREAVEALARVGGDELGPPDGLAATLRPYQLEGFRWLATRYHHRLGGVLADDMGLGKTLQALALMVHAADGTEPPAPWLVVAPTSVVGNWIGEATRFAPGLRAVAITETAAKSGRAVAERAAGADLVVTSYTLSRLDHEQYGAMAWRGALFDEAQFLKNPTSHANQVARRLPAPFKLAMTGTPLENSVRELWAILAVTSPGLLARSEHFDRTYRTPIERHGDAARLDQLRRRIRPIMLRRTKAQVAADLPDKQEQVLELELDPRHRSAYDTYLNRERQKLLGLIDDMGAHRFEVLRSLTLLRQAALDVSLVDPTRTNVPSTKLDALVELLVEATAEGHRALVFSQFTRYLTMARQRIEAAGIACCYLDGTTRNRPQVISRFTDGDAPVFLISLKAGGFGLNLTEADHCILLDPWWNPATEAQAVDRAHRIGQQRKVMVYRLVAKGTIEEKVMALKGRKAALFASVVDGGGFESASLSADDVRALLD